jgi:uncharacterized protein (DUF983 family)
MDCSGGRNSDIQARLNKGSLAAFAYGISTRFPQCGSARLFNAHGKLLEAVSLDETHHY